MLFEEVRTTYLAKIILEDPIRDTQTLCSGSEIRVAVMNADVHTRVDDLAVDPVFERACTQISASGIVTTCRPAPISGKLKASAIAIFKTRSRKVAADDPFLKVRARSRSGISPIHLHGSLRCCAGLALIRSSRD